MSKRWTSIVAGITLTIAVFLNFISEIINYVQLYRMAGRDFVAVAGVSLFLTVLFTVADVLVVVGAFSNKLGLPMILGTGIWTFTAILNTFIRLVQTRGFSVGEFDCCCSCFEFCSRLCKSCDKLRLYDANGLL